MSKMSELELAIRDLRNAADTIKDVADTLAEMFTSTANTEEAPAPAQEPEPTITLVQVREVLSEKSRAGHTEEIRALLQKYGASKLSLVDPVHYKELLAEVEVIGNAT